MINSDYLKNLNNAQKEAVLHLDGPLLIVAGAGSGKTKVLTSKIAHIIKEKKAFPNQILSVTFTNKAAKEMKSRVMEMLGEKELDISIGTFHSICARLLRNEIQPLGYTRHFAIYDVQDQLDLLKVTLKKMNITKDTLAPNHARNQISYFKSKMITPSAQARKARTILEKTIVEVYSAYQKGLRENGALDFDDLLLYPLELFDKHPKILKKYQNKWKYILVDEYQDTNRPQFHFLTRLSKNNHQICVVGDDDQSIYGWRGATIKNILNFDQNFNDVLVVKLEENYRSTDTILKHANLLIEHNRDRLGKKISWNKSSR